MISSSFRKCRIAFFSSFRKFALKLATIQQQPSLKLKKKILEDFYNESDASDKKNIQAIFNFVREKPKIGLAGKSLNSYISSRFFSNSAVNKNADFQELINMLEDQYDRKNQDGVIPMENISQLLADLQSIQGVGSMGKKVEKIDQIVALLSQVELKILMRIISKNLRIGITERSMNFFFQVSSQSGVVNQGLASYSGQQSTIKNQSHFIQPMLAKPLKSIADVFEFCGKKGQKDLIADIKYDGQRTLICYEKGKQFYLTSRRRKSQEEVHSLLYSKLHAQLSSMQNIQSIKIDGQILCISPTGEPFPMSMVRTKVANTEDSSFTKLVYVFDVLEYNGVSLLNYKLIDRRKYIPQSEHLQLCQYLQFTYPEEKDKLVQFYKQSLNNKYEGLIIKGKDDQYFTNSTRKMWGKFKRGCKIDQQSTGVIELDLVVMGVIYGEGKKNQFFATFLLGAYLGDQVIPITRIGTGFTDEELQTFTTTFKQIIAQPMPKEYVMPPKLSVSHFVEPIYVFQVKCQQFTRSPLYQIGYVEGSGGLSLRFPSFMRLRNDKQPKTCTVEEILQYAGNF